VTEAGLRAIGVEPQEDAIEFLRAAGEDTQADPAAASQKATVPGVMAAEEPVETSAALVPALTVRTTLRDAAQRVLAGWDDKAGERTRLADTISALRAILAKPTEMAKVELSVRPGTR
jgi:hypothetical protein